tara:strand:- start:397 stop:537 length:141 start_codon:yes stop_codon:yes gene_type:complete
MLACLKRKKKVEPNNIKINVWENKNIIKTVDLSYNKNKVKVHPQKN